MKTRRTVILAAGALAFVLAAASARADETAPLGRSTVSYDPQGVAVANQESEERTVTADDEDDDADPVLSQSYVRKAQLAKTRKDFNKAREYLLLAVHFDKTSERAWTELAWVSNELKRYDEGGAAALVAILINERNAEAWREAGYSLHKTGEHEKAVEALLIAKRLAPSDTSTVGYLKQARAALKRAEDTVRTQDRERDDGE